ncbi:uncharacterized protein LOC122643872 [Telopea speciosissima]|uniref:uncharacterized protein LOC122643872 n=1 Tax=Telopea speciosissima TaxID=54955 RepID=UPI001CC55FB8|nr:uncharacterized protein LOC122643872 [Telopea speciosissima]
MKDPSFFLLKNSLGAKMKKGFRSFCNGVGSASTLNQNKVECDSSSSCIVSPSIISSAFREGINLEDRPLTLEEMILQLELEEEATRKAKLDDFDVCQRRMSCVNNSDILRSARNALNQYPRFSVDGRDAMYRSSFQNNLAPLARGGRNSVCSSNGIRLIREKDGFADLIDLERTPGLPQTIAGESVLWCEPGVVAKLMGLEAMPVTIGSGKCRKEKLTLNSTIKRRENLRRAERQELENRRRLVIGTNSGCRRFGRGIALSGSNTTGGYGVMKPIAVEHARRKGWSGLEGSIVDVHNSRVLV